MSEDRKKTAAQAPPRQDGKPKPEANREQYEIEKDITELINIKCHDLKHQFSMLDGQLSERQIAELSESINIYDSIFKTGNLC